MDSIFGNDWEKEFELVWNRTFNEVQTSKSLPTAKTKRWIEIEKIVEQALRELRQELGKTWLPNSIFGTRLHTKVADLVRGKNYSVFVEKPLKKFPHLSITIINMKVKDYLANNNLAWLENNLKRDQLIKSVGDLKPDLVIRGPATTIWDLTSRERTEHVAKTMLYAHILSSNNQLTRIAETYWSKFRGK